MRPDLETAIRTVEKRESPFVLELPETRLHGWCCWQPLCDQEDSLPENETSREGKNLEGPRD